MMFRFNMLNLNICNASQKKASIKVRHFTVVANFLNVVVWSIEINYLIIKATSKSCVGIKLLSFISNVVALTFLTLPFPFQQNDTNSLGSRSTVSLKLLIGFAQLAPVVRI